MKNKNFIEPKIARKNISQKLINQGEISTATTKKQVEGKSQATTVQETLPENNKKNSGRKENYITNSENLNSELFILDSNKSNALTEEHLNSDEPEQTDLQNQSEQIVSQEQASDSIDEFIENTANVYLLRAKTLFECEDSQARELAVKTIKDVNHNIKTGWLLIGIAAHRVLLNTTPLKGGWGKKDDLETGRVKALKKLAQDCVDKGAEVSFKTLYNYSRWVRILLEEPLKKFDGDEKTIRRERIVLMEKLFALPPTVAKALSTSSKASKKLKIACQMETAKGAPVTNAELKKAIKNHFKVNKSSNSAAPHQNDNLKIEMKTNLAGFFTSQIDSEAKRTKLKPEQIKDLYVSFLQMMLSTVQDMGVKK